MIRKYSYSPKTSNAHRDLSDFLNSKKENNSDIKTALKYLNRLKVRRVSADYNDIYDFEGQNVERSSGFAIEYCKKVFEAISKLRQRKKKRI